MKRRCELTTLVLTLVLWTGDAGAQGGVLVYCYQPLTEPPHKQIYSIHADGSVNTQLTSSTVGLNYPDWSPEGARIAVGAYVSSSTWSIYTMAADGSDLVRLTDAPGVWDAEPDWSPDGTRILFARRYPGQPLREEIWIVNADGSELHDTGIAGSAPQWSSDGERLVYQALLGGVYRVRACHVDGTNVVDLAATGSNEMLPSWSPDGQQVAFTSFRDGNPEIYLMDRDGSNPRRLTTNTVPDFSPAWSPDGSLIAWDSDLAGGNHTEIYLMSADGSNQRRVTHTSAVATAINPDWMPQRFAYLGRNPPGLLPERFPPDQMCGNADWFWHGSPVFSPDLKEMYWGKYTKYATYHRLELACMKVEENRWTAMHYPPFANLDYDENAPFFHGGRDSLYYVSNAFADGILRVVRTPTGWSDPVQVPIPLPPGAQRGWQFSIARNGTLYFDLWTSPTELNIYASRLANGHYQPPENVTAINSAGFDFSPYVDADERFLLFASNRPGGFGSVDLYLSVRGDAGAWEPPINLGPTFNSDGDDVSPRISPEGLYFFFTTIGPGDNDFCPYWVDAQIIYDFVPEPSTATLLQRSGAGYRGDCIEVTWTLSEIDAGTEFQVLRTALPRADFEPDPAAAIERSGLSFAYRDVRIEPGRSYRYRVEFKDVRGTHLLFETEPVSTSPLPPTLFPNVPNPFNPSTRIRYFLPMPVPITLRVDDVSGRHVAQLAAGVQGRGFHESTWNGCDDHGQPMGSGVYLCVLEAGGARSTTKVLLLR